jgi:hypothetical protein
MITRDLWMLAGTAAAPGVFPTVATAWASQRPPSRTPAVSSFSGPAARFLGP